MKKGIKFSLRILGSFFGLAAVGCGLFFTLKHFGLMFRSWTGMLFFAAMVLLGFAFIGGVVYTLAKAYSQPQEEKRKRTIQKVFAAGGMIGTLAGTAVLGIILLFGSVLAREPEHVTEKYGQKMIAYVDSFLDVNVSYHEYKNFIVCGYPELGWEWYGDGGYDPFEQDPIPEPKIYKFYDKQGNTIAQSERQWGSNQDPESGGAEGAGTITHN